MVRCPSFQGWLADGRRRQRRAPEDGSPMEGHSRQISNSSSVFRWKRPVVTGAGKIRRENGIRPNREERFPNEEGQVLEEMNYSPRILGCPRFVREVRLAMQGDMEPEMPSDVKSIAVTRRGDRELQVIPCQLQNTMVALLHEVSTPVGPESWDLKQRRA
uniref:Uncharacterized protein n=1 Tax=Leersia perrieri TaxID=77586 RepID=A0A0D9WRL0_9ORYZ